MQTNYLFLSLFSVEEGMFCDETTVCPLEATEDDLLVAHTKQYISRLKVQCYSCNYSLKYSLSPRLAPYVIVSGVKQIFASAEADI